jgi:hypothetical protein
MKTACGPCGSSAIVPAHDGHKRRPSARRPHGGPRSVRAALLSTSLVRPPELGRFHTVPRSERKKKLCRSGQDVCSVGQHAHRQPSRPKKVTYRIAKAATIIAAYRHFRPENSILPASLVTDPPDMSGGSVVTIMDIGSGGDSNHDVASPHSRRTTSAVSRVVVLRARR